MVASEAVPTPASTSTGTFEDDAQVVGIADPQTRADQTGQRHDGDTADGFQLASDDGIVAGVDHDVEAVGDQGFGGLEGLDDIGE